MSFLFFLCFVYGHSMWSKSWIESVIVSKQLGKKSIYIVHRRETYNALNASVRCE